MKKEELRILFLGTPEFAVESLKILVENGYNVAGVVTMPDKPAGRGYKLQHSPVKQYALEKGLPLLQPENLKDEEFLANLKRLRVGLQVVVAFRMLPEVVWSMPPKGTFNLHASLLPQYRGAAPINWAIINGEKETGVTTFFLTHEIDTGEIIFSEKTKIHPTDNAGTIHDRLMAMGAKLVKKTVDAILEDQVTPVPQNRLYSDPSTLKEAPKIHPGDCRIDWSRKGEDVYNFIRGLLPYPAAWCMLAQRGTVESVRVKVFAAEKLSSGLSSGKEGHQPGSHQTRLQPGSIKTDNKTYIDVVVEDGFLRITDLQLSGKKRMKTIDFLNGYRFDEGDHF